MRIKMRGTATAFNLHSIMNEQVAIEFFVRGF